MWAGLALFAIASLVCGFAPDAGVLIAARAVQGIGGAAMFATAPTRLLASYQGRDRGTASGLWCATNGAAAAAGPLLGGVLTRHISWPVILWINLPVAVVAIVLTRRFMAADRRAAGGRKNRIDLFGAATFSVAAGALVYGLIRGPTAAGARPALLSPTLSPRSPSWPSWWWNTASPAAAKPECWTWRCCATPPSPGC
ncbi:MFS transporter [Streptomyces sp. OE57]|uniref:MFS transporter n=1 Tax=Streptomyces lacaronensis TaxID=3379885 RepID=UPI0039B72E99